MPWFFRRKVVLNIEASSVRLLVLKGKKVEVWGSAPLEPGMVSKGLILQPHKVAEAINSLFQRLGMPKGKACLSITGLNSTYCRITLPHLKPSLLEEAIRREAEKELPVSPEKLYLSYQSFERKDGEEDFFILGVPRNIVDAHMKVMRECGIKPELMELKPLALARAAGRREALIIDLESDSFTIVLVSNELPVMRNIPRRGKLEDDLVLLKKEFLRTVEFYNRQHPESPLASSTPIFLTGELSEEANVVGLIKEWSGFPLESLPVLLDLPQDFPIGLYAANIGLALKGRKESRLLALDLNILPVSYRPRPFPVGLSLLSLAVIMTLGSLFFLYQAKTEAGGRTVQLQAEFSQVRKELQALRTKKEELNKAIVGVEEELKKATQTSAHPEFGPGLRLITDGAKTYGLRFSSIALSPEGGSLRGEADDPSKVVAFVRALQKGGTFSTVELTELNIPNFTITLTIATPQG